MKRAKRIVLTACTLLIVAWIWGHSMMPATVSAQESQGLLAALVALFNRFGLPFTLTEHMLRKLAHFSEYLGLGLFLRATVRSWRARGYGAILALLLLVIPFVDETIQLFTAGRSGQLSDVWLDLAGGCSGVLLGALFYLVILHKKRKG